MADIFLSYAREDIKKAKLLANALENQGWTVFWDRTSLLAGQDFEAVIEQAINQAGCMIVAWSKSSKQSDWVRGEAGTGRELNILVPILFEQVEPPIAFRSLHTENLTDWEGETDAPDFLKLCQAINERIKSKTAPSMSSTPFNTASNKAIERAKTNFLKRLIRTIWDWLSVTKHQQTLAFISGGLAVVIAGSWKAYLHFSEPTKESNPSITVSGNGIANTGSITSTATTGGNATNIVGNNNTIGDINAAAKIKDIVTTLTNQHQLDTQAKDEQIKALTEAVTALSKGHGVIGTDVQIKTALDTLAQGDTAQAKSLFAKAAQKADQEAKEGAKAYRNLGALAYLDNTQEALAAYRRATELDPDNAEGWNNLGLLLYRVGDLDKAIAAYGKVLRLGEAHGDKEEVAWAYSNWGNVYQTRGELDKAVDYYQKALVLHEGLGSKEGMALNYGNLGAVYQARGELDKAVDYYQKALVLHEGLDSKEGMALNYSNLGAVYQARGELDKAVDYHQKALVLNEGLGRKEGMAANFTNLGVVYKTRGELDEAVDYYQKALVLYEGLGSKQGMAADYGNLGSVYQIRGELDKAVEYYQKALALDEVLGRKEDVAHNYTNLGFVYQTVGELDEAVDYYQNSLMLYEALGSKEGIAADYGNLGSVYYIRGELEKAVEYYQKALMLYEGLGSKEGMAQAYGNLGLVYKKQGHKEQAKQAYQKSIDLFKSLENQTMGKQVQDWLEALWMTDVVD